VNEDYYKTLIKDIIENNNKEETIKIIANKLNEKQISNEKEIFANIEKAIEIERLNKQIKEYQKALDETTSEKIDLENIIKEVREYIETLNEYGIGKQAKKELLEIFDKGE
jgi:hypothetical protein